MAQRSRNEDRTRDYFFHSLSVGVSISIQGFICGSGNCVMESFHFIKEERGHCPLIEKNRKRRS